MDSKLLEEIKERHSRARGLYEGWQMWYRADVNELLEEIDRLSKCNDNQLKVIKNQESQIDHYVSQTVKLRHAVTKFLEAKGNDLCHENRYELANAFDITLPEDGWPCLPSEEEFEQRCNQYRKELYGYDYQEDGSYTDQELVDCQKMKPSHIDVYMEHPILVKPNWGPSVRIQPTTFFCKKSEVAAMIELANMEADNGK